jgi:HSP20 family protein
MNKMHFYRPMMTGSIPTSTHLKTTSIPASNISKSQKGYNLEIAVPGFSKEELEIILEEGNLKITGKYEVEKETKEQCIHKGFTKQPFEISFKLSDTIDNENIDAKVENGLLRINLGLKTEAQKEVKNIAII